MREIKFRAWDQSLGKMVFGPSLDTNPDGAIYSCNYDKNGNLVNRPLMQFTGLLDSGGSEIYEGDYVRVYSHGEESIHKVFWGGEYPAFDLSGWAGECNGLHYCMCDPDTTIEVVGNIHKRNQNHELLDNAE